MSTVTETNLLEMSFQYPDSLFLIVVKTKCLMQQLG